MAAQGAEGEIREVGEGGEGKIHTAEAFKARAAARPTQALVLLPPKGITTTTELWNIQL